MGKPCVINASLGDIFGSHDGTDLEAQMIDAMITAKKGRCMVAAAGNWGNLFMHLGYDVSAADTNFTFYRDTLNNPIYIQFWADSNEIKNIHFALSAIDTNSWDNRATTVFTTAANHRALDTTSIYNGLNRIGKIISLFST